MYLAQPPDDFFYAALYRGIYSSVALGMIAALAGFFFLLEKTTMEGENGYEVIGIKLVFIAQGCGRLQARLTTGGTRPSRRNHS